MLRMRTTLRLDQIEMGLRNSAERHGGSVLAASHISQLLQGQPVLKGADAVTVTLGFPELYAPLLRSDIRFAAFLPSRVALCESADGVSLEAVSPREYCRILHRAEVEPLAVALEDVLRLVMDEAAHRQPRGAEAEHSATEDQINMRATVPQRIDRRGTKTEELAGTGVHDAQGG